MADISISGATRPKSTIVNAVTAGFLAPAATVNDSTDSIIHYIQFENVTPNPVTFTCASSTTVNGSDVVTGANLSNVRVGDGVAGTGIAGGSTVIALGSNSIQLSANATASGAVTLTITPPVIDANLIAVKHDLTISGSTLTDTINIYKTDGTKVKGTTADTSTYADYTLERTIVVTIDLDTYFTNARVAKSA